MSEQVQRQPSQPTPPTASEQDLRHATRGSGSGFDDLLDSIDAVLETNAEEYVRSFVQKGGQ